MPLVKLDREISKSKLAMYLRTKCDRELYLSLFSNNHSALIAAGIPIPLKSRPGVQIITKAGYQFEWDQFDMLIEKLPNNVIHEKSGRAPANLIKALQASNPKTFILQPEIEPEEFREVAFNNLGVSDINQKFIPPLKGMRPDILYVGQPGSASFEVLPNGKRKPIEPDDSRCPIHVIDLKNITEANASYSAEVCLYAFFLSNWLKKQKEDISSAYFISDEVYLWRHVTMPNFTSVMASKDGGDHEKRLSAILQDLRDGLVNFLVYMPSVVKFFVEDVPRVVRKGDEEGWKAVDYHVNPRCGSCDWLGNKSWLSPKDQPLFDSNPENYCFQNAEGADHLSKMPTLSKGAVKALNKGGHQKVVDLVGIAANAPSLKGHTLLKRDRNNIGTRADSLVNNNSSVDSVSKVGVLAKWWSAEYDIIVNFDAGSGLLTGIAIRAVLAAPYGKFFDDADPSKSFHFLGEAAFVVPQENPTAEWSAILGFLEQFAQWLDDAEKIYADKGWGSIRTQLCFWEPRQYEELCNAFGRHLLQILDLKNKSQKALAWVFPPEELMEKEDEVCPSIVFIKDVINSSVILPQRFATTLLGTAEHYHHSKLPPRVIDNYYVEPLGNAIPRERIFEIWKSLTGTVRIFGKDVGIPEACTRYGTVLKAQAFALGTITAKLRQDLKGVLSGKAAILSLSIPQGTPKIAHDSKLWNQWNVISAAADATKGKLNLLKRPEWLESSYESIILTNVIKNHGNNQFTFEVNDDSTEAKIEEGDRYCTLGIISWPGFPLQSAASLDLNIDKAHKYYFMPMHKVIAATIDQFDRASKTILVSFRPSFGGVQDIFDSVMRGLIPFGKEPIYLLERMPYDESDITTEILRQIGNPKCSRTAAQSLSAMGRSAAAKIPQGTDTDSPIARVLWTSDKLAKTIVRTKTEIESFTKFAKTATTHGLNDSQLNAVRGCASSQLSIIWGPPGTGKTDTLAAYLHATIREEKQKKILLTGPNYRTVEELAARLLKAIDSDPQVKSDFFWVYSKSREPKDLPPVNNKNIDLRSFSLLPGSQNVNDLIDSIGDTNRITIIATTAHVVDKVMQSIGASSRIEPIFDLVVLDESSQIPVTLALRPLCALKEHAQIVIAGDHLQMPPIHSLEPPLGAEYLVSSIQTYLITRFKISKQSLLINYRSNQDLVDYAKTLGYPSELEAFQNKKQLLQLEPLDSAIKSLPADFPITDAYQALLIPERRVTTLIHDDPVSSQANEVEAGLVAGLAYCIRECMARELDLGDGKSGSPFDDDTFFDIGIGIVTPHKAQKALVVRSLIKAFPNADRQKVYDAVDTVERFQGGERQTIIVSFGVGDTDIIEGEEAFLLQMERTNVAVSRAMAKCIVLMPKSLAYHLPSDKKAAEASVAIKSYVEEFCNHREHVIIKFDEIERDGEVRWR